MQQSRYYSTRQFASSGFMIFRYLSATGRYCPCHTPIAKIKEVFDSFYLRFFMPEALRYYSTNRNLDNQPGLVPFKETVSFREALLMGQAPDQGLFMPEIVPSIPLEKFKNLKGKSYAEAAMLVAQTFLAGEIDEDKLRRIVDESYNFP